MNEKTNECVENKECNVYNDCKDCVEEIVIKDSEGNDYTQWILMQKNVENKKYNEISKELESLKSMIIELHTIVNNQNENIENTYTGIEKIREKIKSVDSDLVEIKNHQTMTSRFDYIKDYIFPVFGITTINYPIFWMFGPKTGMISSALSYMLWRVK